MKREAKAVIREMKSNSRAIERKMEKRGSKEGAGVDSRSKTQYW